MSETKPTEPEAPSAESQLVYLKAVVTAIIAQRDNVTNQLAEATAQMTLMREAMTTTANRLAKLETALSSSFVEPASTPV